MEDAFGSFARYYDLMYSDKNYEKEVEFVEQILSTYSARTRCKILDISCGTGGHSNLFAKRGHLVLALDISREMVLEANRKARANEIENISFIRGDMTCFAFQEKFDLCVSMFDSIDYLATYEKIERMFHCVSHHLSEGSLFVFQFWNGVSVLTTRPSIRKKTVRGNGIEISRFCRPVLHPLENKCEIHYTLSVHENGTEKELHEDHELRYFFPEEIRFLLLRAGFELLGFHPSFDLQMNISENDWSIIAIAKRNTNASVMIDET